MIAWTDLAARWWSWIVPLSIQFALLAIAFVLADRLLARRVPTAVRAALMWALLLRVALLPDFASPVAIARVLGEVPDARAPASASLAAGLCTAWALGVTVCGVAALVRALRGHRAWLADARTAPAGVVALARQAAGRLRCAALPRLLLSTRASGPASVGLFRPVIVLPARMATGDARSLEHVLLHELAHVARRDALAACAWGLARALLWFHPLVHSSARRAATLREIACDERAARAVGGAHAYRRTLLDLARPWARPQPAVASAFLPPEAQLLARLAALDRPLGWSHGRERAAGLVSFAIVAACCVPLGPSGDAIELPALDDLQGCLRQRYAVMAALAEEQSTARTGGESTGGPR